MIQEFVATKEKGPIATVNRFAGEAKNRFTIGRWKKALLSYAAFFRCNFELITTSLTTQKGPYQEMWPNYAVRCT